MTDTAQAVVNDGVAAFADIELALSTTLPAIVARGMALSTPMTSGVQAAALQAQLAGLLALTLALHNTCTKIAQANNVDVADPNGGGVRNTY